MGYIALFVCLFLGPESPEWLLMKGRRKEAIIALNKIAAFNGGEMIDKDQKFVI